MKDIRICFCITLNEILAQFVKKTFNRTKTILALYACFSCIKFRKKLSLYKVKLYYDVTRKYGRKRKKYFLNFCKVLPSKKITIGSYF